MRYHLRSYSAGYVLAALWLVFWAAQTWFGWVEYRADEAAHGQAAALAGYAPVWARTTLENLQSEAWQVLLAALVFRTLFFKGAPESKNPEEGEA
ncbi:MAG: hypothetical protein M3Q10_14635 [Chloroflexota bacterium]|nr:hypothetical protein [Chloroflexota bacterium]